jgi:hypothetical protein
MAFTVKSATHGQTALEFSQSLTARPLFLLALSEFHFTAGLAPVLPPQRRPHGPAEASLLAPLGLRLGLGHIAVLDGEGTERRT